MSFQFEGQTYEDVDFAKVTMPQWRQIKRKLGLTIGDVETGLGRTDPDAVTAFWWLTMLQHDPGLELDPDVDFDSHAFLNAWAADVNSKKADPTTGVTHQGGATHDSNGSSPATSTKSSTITGSHSPTTAISATGTGTGSPSADLSRM